MNSRMAIILSAEPTISSARRITAGATLLTKERNREEVTKRIIRKDVDLKICFNVNQNNSKYLNIPLT